MSISETLEIEAYLDVVSEEARHVSVPKHSLTVEESEQAALIIPREYQSAITTFESPLMEYIRNLQVKLTPIPKEISFISSIYSLTNGTIIHIIDANQGNIVKKDLFDFLYPLAQNSRQGQKYSNRSKIAREHEIEQILNRCYLVLFTNFSQMQAVIIQGIIYDIERQGVHLPIQSSTEIETISHQYLPIVQNQAVIIRNMFRHLFPQFQKHFCHYDKP